MGRRSRRRERASDRFLRIAIGAALAVLILLSWLSFDWLLAGPRPIQVGAEPSGTGEKPPPHRGTPGHVGDVGFDHETGMASDAARASGGAGGGNGAGSASGGPGSYFSSAVADATTGPGVISTGTTGGESSGGSGGRSAASSPGAGVGANGSAGPGFTGRPLGPGGQGVPPSGGVAGLPPGAGAAPSGSGASGGAAPGSGAGSDGATPLPAPGGNGPSLSGGPVQPPIPTGGSAPPVSGQSGPLGGSAGPVPGIAALEAEPGAGPDATVPVPPALLLFAAAASTLALVSRLRRGSPRSHGAPPLTR